MRVYKKISQRGKLSRVVFEKAATALEENKQKTLRGVAKDFGICHVTLGRYLKKRTVGEGLIDMGYKKHRQVFNKKQEKLLAEYMVKCNHIYFGLTQREKRKLAFDCALKYNLSMPKSWTIKREAGSDWLTSFLKRNQNILMRSPEATNLSRVTSFNPENFSLCIPDLSSIKEPVAAKSNRPDSTIPEEPLFSVMETLSADANAAGHSSLVESLPHCSNGLSGLQNINFLPEDIKSFPQNFPCVVDDIKIEKEDLHVTTIKVIPAQQVQNPVMNQKYSSRFRHEPAKKGFLRTNKSPTPFNEGSCFKLPIITNINSQSKSMNIGRREINLEQSLSYMKVLLDETSKGDAFSVFGKNIAQKLCSSNSDLTELHIAKLLIEKILEDLVIGVNKNWKII